MLGFVIAVRNIIIATVLAWVGLEHAPSDDQNDAPSPSSPSESLRF
ncbi:MAG: hypothetical protein AAGK23_10255 [Pseudomonadota bacterium]